MLTIEPIPKKEMIEDAIRSFPDECCGFMFGKEEGEERIITSVMIINNSKEGDKRRRFEIAAMDYMRAEKYAEEHNLFLLGIYHSHPDHPSTPSEHDRVAAQTYFSYLIISVKKKEFASVQSWRLNEQSRFEEEIIIN